MRIENGSTTTRIPFLLVDATDDETAETGIAPTVQISKNGGAFANVTNTVVEVGNGWYYVVLTTAETNTDGFLAVRAFGTGTNEWRDYHEVYTPDTSPVSISLTAAQMNAIADHLLRRNYANARLSSDGDTVDKRSFLGLLAQEVNRRGYDDLNSEFDVYHEDDITLFFSVAVTTSLTAVNITELNPSG